MRLESLVCTGQNTCGLKDASHIEEFRAVEPCVVLSCNNLPLDIYGLMDKH